jgi:hypothetical protein
MPQRRITNPDRSSGQTTMMSKPTAWLAKTRNACLHAGNLMLGVPEAGTRIAGSPGSLPPQIVPA